MEIAILRSWRRLYTFEAGQIIKGYPVAVGRPSLPTPLGTFRVVNKQLNPGGPFGVRWLGLSRAGYGIHGTNDNTSIGKSISHGCVRMYNDDAIAVFNITNVGTTVRIVQTPENLPETYQRPTGITYEVTSGDTLYGLSKRFATTVTAISESNHLHNTDNTIYPGQMLLIPN